MVAAFSLRKVAPVLARDGACPIVGVGRELVFLEWVDFVEDEAGDGCGGSVAW